MREGLSRFRLREKTREGCPEGKSPQDFTLFTFPKGVKSKLFLTFAERHIKEQRWRANLKTFFSTWEAFW
ncbi:MAG: hypothetical protein PUI88_00950 [Prevotella sp.]|nr:hypothetical protein [Prevotella sp.]